MGDGENKEGWAKYFDGNSASVPESLGPRQSLDGALAHQEPHDF